MLSDYETRILRAIFEEKGYLRVCMYCRKSQKDITGNSIDTQLMFNKMTINEIEKDLKIKVLFNETEDVFKEDNKSGTNIECRDEFQRMQRQIKNGTYSACIVYKIDRFSRNVEDTIKYKEEMKHNHCLLISADWRDTGDANGEMNLNTMSSISQYMARNSAALTVNGMKTLANQAVPIGRYPFGYRICDKKIIIDENEAAIVRFMFELAAKGTRIHEIVDKCKENKFFTRQKKEFTSNTISGMLRNERYVGTYLWSEGTLINKKRQKKNRVALGEIDEIRIEDAFDPIISKGIFKRVQEILSLNENTREYYQNQDAYLLTGILECEECGTKMIGERHMGGKKKEYRRYYACGKHQRDKECSTTMINADYVDKVIKGLVFQIVKQISLNKNSLLDKSNDEINELKSIINNNSLELSRINKQIERLVDLQIEHPELDSIYGKKIAKHLKEQEKIKNTLRKNEKKINNLKSVFHDKIETSELTEEILFKDRAYARTLIRLIFKSIKYGNSGLVIEFNIK